ncbi:MAG: PAS domain S-box protein [Chloroflexi bacterium]|nr:PAS domain S-box protein [Chloroflexota bacterium]
MPGNILIVEDENIIAMDLKNRLVALGYTVCASVPSGEAAIEKADAFHPDLVLMDIVLKGELDGIQAAAQIRQRLNIPVIYLTAYSDARTLARAKVTEPHGYILKPFEDRELHSTIEMALYKHTVEQQLRESEERFRVMADSAPVMIWLSGVDTQSTFFNKQWLGFRGRRLEQEIGNGWLEGVHPDDIDRVVSEYLTAFHARRDFLLEYRIGRADGEPRWILDHGTPRWMPDGAFAGYIDSAVDITERKQVEQALHYRVEFEKLVSKISTDLLNYSTGQIDRAIIDALGLIGAFANVDRSYIFNFSEDSKTHSNTFEWCAEGIAPQKNYLQNIPSDQAPWRMEILRRFEIVHIPRVADLPAEARAEKAMLEQHGVLAMLAVPLIYQKTLIGYLGFDVVRQEKTWMDEDIALLKTAGEIFANVLIRERAEYAMRASEERWRTYIEHANDLIFALDATGRITLVNRATCDALGYRAAELLGKSPLDLVAPDKLAEATSALAAIFGGEDIVQMEVEVLTKDRRRVIIEVRGRILQEQGRVIGTFHIARDVTERKLAEAKLEYYSTHDALTDIHNRACFEDALARLEHSRLFPITIVVADVNGLKQINDQLGHATGDATLKHAARILRETFRAEDIVARIGGDEFAALLPNTDAATAAEIIARVRERLAAHTTAQSDPPLRLAIGAATAEKGNALEQVFKLADRQMYRDKAGDER